MFRSKKQIDAYDGYGKPGRVYAYGRIVRSRNKPMDFSKQSMLHNLGASMGRILSREVSGEPITINVGDASQSLQTNSEGYYRVDWQVSEFAGHVPSDNIGISLVSEDQTQVQGKIYCQAYKSKYIVVSDIDDTVLVTQVNNLLAVAYNTAFVASNKRSSIQGSSAWYHKLAVESDSSLFYLSNSPWNLYYYLKNFLHHYRYPDGPLLLRDFGFAKKDDLQDYDRHKHDEIIQLISFYPEQEFILIGDGGEHDADIYLNINSEYPDRVKAIFIYRLGDEEKQSRIEKISEGVDKFYFIQDAQEGERLCHELGFF